MKTNDALGCVGGVTGCLFASVWIPFIGPFLSLLAPLPFLYYAAKLGFYQGLQLAALAVAVTGVLGALSGHPRLTLFAVEFGVLGVTLGELFRRGVPVGATIAIATGVMLLLGLGILFVVGLQSNTNPLEMLLAYLRGQLDLTIQAYKEMGIQQEGLAELESYSQAFMQTLARIFPSLMAVGTGFAVWLNVMLARPLFRMGNVPYPDFGPLDQWRPPEELIWVFIGSGFALFLLGGVLQSVAVNLLIVTVTVYFFHGISILLFFLNKHHVPNWIRLGIYFLIMIQQLFLLVLAVAGIFDQWADFRKIHRKASPSE